jgi:hypothetical protein
MAKRMLREVREQSLELGSRVVSGEGTYSHVKSCRLPFEVFMRLRREGRARCLLSLENLMTRSRKLSAREAAVTVRSSDGLAFYRLACRLGCFRDGRYLVVDDAGNVVASRSSSREAEEEASLFRGVDSEGTKFAVVVVSDGRPAGRGRDVSQSESVYWAYEYGDKWVMVDQGTGVVVGERLDEGDARGEVVRLNSQVLASEVEERLAAIQNHLVLRYRAMRSVDGGIHLVVDQVGGRVLGAHDSMIDAEEASAVLNESISDVG